MNTLISNLGILLLLLSFAGGIFWWVGWQMTRPEARKQRAQLLADVAELKEQAKTSRAAVWDLEIECWTRFQYKDSAMSHFEIQMKVPETDYWRSKWQKRPGAEIYPTRESAEKALQEIYPNVAAYVNRACPWDGPLKMRVRGVPK